MATANRPLTLRALSLALRVAHRASFGRIGSLDPGAAAPRGAVLRAITRLHRRLYRFTGGIIGGNAGGLATLLLTTTGRKSGILRTVPLPYFPVPAGYGDAVVVVGSFAGNPKHPEWVLNLQACPDVTVQIGFRRRAARADVATDEERSALWPSVVERAPMYADYQRRTERVIPLVMLRLG